MTIEIKKNGKQKEHNFIKFYFKNESVIHGLISFCLILCRKIIQIKQI